MVKQANQLRNSPCHNLLQMAGGGTPPLGPGGYERPPGRFAPRGICSLDGSETRRMTGLECTGAESRESNFRKYSANILTATVMTLVLFT